jgi:hypothetical protein
MTSSESIPSPATPGDLQTIIDDLTGYLRHQKEMGIARISLSESSMEILAAWGRPRPSRKRFTHMGPPSANVVLVDGTGQFFKGEAGALLKKILEAMKLAPDRICLCNAPDPDQVTTFLESVHPEVVIALGDQAAQVMTGTRNPVAAVRGQFVNVRGIPVMPTFHPSELLKDPSLKRPVWEDMQQVMQKIGMPS